MALPVQSAEHVGYSAFGQDDWGESVSTDFERARQAGESMELEQAVAFARGSPVEDELETLP